MSKFRRELEMKEKSEDLFIRDIGEDIILIEKKEKRKWKRIKKKFES